jgi:oryzin
MKCGITVVIAAGNGNVTVDSCSPARVEEAITVGSIGETDKRSSFSNFGEGVDIFAPGENILSSWRGGEGNETQAATGTSMASPFVAGLAAYVMDLYGPREPAEMKKLLEKWATKGRVQDARGSADRIAFNGNREERG